MKTQLSCLLSLLLLAASCKTPSLSPVAQTDYAVIEMGAGSFLVYYQGQGTAPEERIRDLGMLRACYVARERGFRYFAAVDRARSDTHATFFESDDHGQDLRQGLVIRGFADKPSNVFVFKTASLQKLIERKYKAGYAGAEL